MSHQGNDPTSQRQQGSGQPQRRQQPTRQPQQQSQQPQQQPPSQQPQFQQQPQQRGATQPGQQQRPQQTPQQHPSGGGSQRQPTQQRAQTGRPPAMTQQQQMSHQPGPQGMPQTMGMGQPQQMQQPGPQRQRGGLEPMRIDEFVQTDVVTCQQDTPIRTVVSMMSDEDVGTVIVVDEDDQQPMGILTDRKIALALERTPDIASQEASRLLDGDLVTCTSDMTVMEVLERMKDAEVRRLPVIDDDGNLQGIISLDDILIHLGNTFDSIGELIEKQIHE